MDGISCMHAWQLTSKWCGCAQTETGYRLEAVTVRKLEFENDAFAFGDKVIEKWYPTVEVGSNKGILVLVTTGKDGALTGGPAFNKVPGSPHHLESKYPDLPA